MRHDGTLLYICSSMVSGGGWPKEWKDEVARRGGSSSQQHNLQFVSCTGQVVSLLLDEVSAGLEEVRTGGGRAWTCFVCMCGSSRYVSWGGHVAARACSGRQLDSKYMARRTDGLLVEQGE